MRSLAALGLILVLLCAACSGGATSEETTTAAIVPVERYISQADLGDAWPLTVPGGTLRCEGPGAVSFMSDEGIVHAVNARGKTWSKTNNLAWLDVDLIRGDDPNVAGRKLALGPLINAGLALCKKVGGGTTPSE